MTKAKRARKHNVTPKHAVTKKKKWVDMEMYRVPLNHEQAVLTCCMQVVRVRVHGTAGQCNPSHCPYTCSTEQALSS